MLRSVHRDGRTQDSLLSCPQTHALRNTSLRLFWHLSAALRAGEKWHDAAPSPAPAATETAGDEYVSASEGGDADHLAPVAAPHAAHAAGEAQPARAGEPEIAAIKEEVRRRACSGRGRPEALNHDEANC